MIEVVQAFDRAHIAELRVAERVGFEPTVTSLPRRFSRPVP